jgi:hypothetical protein
MKYTTIKLTLPKGLKYQEIESLKQKANHTLKQPTHSIYSGSNVYMWWHKQTKQTCITWITMHSTWPVQQFEFSTFSELRRFLTAQV